MKINIYLKELADNKKPLFFWSVGIILFLLTAMSKYQGYARSNVSIDKLLKNLPPSFSALFGLGAIDVGTAAGFFSITVLYLSIILGVHAVLLGSGIIAKEEIDRTAEFLFAKPITRKQAFIAKVAAAFTAMAFLCIITALSSLIIVSAFNSGPSINGDILFLMPAVFFLQLIFLIIGIFFAAVTRKPKRAGQLSAAFLLASFILSAFIDIAEKFKYLKYITPFKYFDAKTIFINSKYNFFYILVTVVFVVSFVIISMIVFRKRDLNI